jgi:hypothetical protein
LFEIYQSLSFPGIHTIAELDYNLIIDCDNLDSEFTEDIRAGPGFIWGGKRGETWRQMTTLER